MVHRGLANSSRGVIFEEPHFSSSSVLYGDYTSTHSLEESGIIKGYSTSQKRPMPLWLKKSAWDLRHWPHLQPMQATPLFTASHRILSSVARLSSSKSAAQKMETLKDEVQKTSPVTGKLNYHANATSDCFRTSEMAWTVSPSYTVWWVYELN